MKKLIAIIAIAFAPVILTACTTTQDGSKIDQTSKNRSGSQKANYTDQAGNAFLIEYKWDTLFQGYGVEITRPANPLSTGETDDALVQNTLRDYFSANVCGSGFFAGITNPYGHMREGRWGAKIKCTTKKQANI